MILECQSKKTIRPAMLGAVALAMVQSAPAMAGEDGVNRMAVVDTGTAGSCLTAGAIVSDRAACVTSPHPAPFAAAQAPPARITVGRAVDLSGQEPVRYLSSSASLDQSRSVIMSSSGRFRDTVRLLTPPPGTGSGGAPEGMPLRSSRLSSGFGLRMHPLLNQVRMHTGVDLAAAMGEPVHATSAGVIMSAGWQGGYGLAVRINHGKGVETLYGHLSRLNVSPGQTIKPGDVIGFVGSTGRSTGPHLHYEVRKDGRPIDPSSSLHK